MVAQWEAHCLWKCGSDRASVAAGVDSSYPKIVTIQAEPCLLYQVSAAFSRDNRATSPFFLRFYSLNIAVV